MQANSDFIKNLIVKTIRAYDPKAEILLYGSRARGNERDNSDWDILILIDGDCVTLEQFEALSYDLWSKGLEYGQEINSIIHTHKQWESSPPSLFKWNILKESIAL